MKWGLDIIATLTGGVASGESVVSSFTIDSREAGPGSLFVALAGEHRDGHEFVPNALAAGAAVLVKPGSLPAGGTGVEVADPLTALMALATRRRQELFLPVAGITGSNGKTTTKDLLAGALGPRAYKSPRSFNNEIGVPLTILGVPEEASSLVVEVGSRGKGHIALLAPMIRPEVAVITNVARAHLETFGTEDAIVDAKWELVEALDSGGFAVLPVGDERLTSRRSANVITFGEDPAADVAVGGVSLGSDGRASCTLTHQGISVDTTLAVAGRHQPVNLAAAVAAAVAMEADFEEAVQQGAATPGSAWRMEVDAGQVTIVNDAYNANPDSMAASLATVAAMPGRHVAVLGRMHELGTSEAESHREVGALARELGFAAVVVVGEDPGIAEGAGPIARPVDGIEQARAVLGGYLTEGDVVLVKASRAEGLEVLAETLRGEYPMIAMLTSAGVAFGMTMVLTPVAIRFFRRRQIGQYIQEEVEHHHKHGVPTMGGVVFIFAVMVAYLAAHLRLWSHDDGWGMSWREFQIPGLLVLVAFVGMGAIGFLDDLSKVSKERNLGLRKRWKFAGQLAISGVFAWGAVNYGVSTEIAFTRGLGIDLGWLYVIWVLLMLVGAANAVNFTDGLDGLAAGSGGLVFGAFVVISFWQFRHPQFYGIIGTLELAILAAGLMAAAAGFLWWNTSPAKIIMGDTGSQALGGAMAALALLTHTHLLLVILGGLYVIETVSVILQIISFRGWGKRIFRMAPIHHHFELKGWPESTIVVRFWIIAALSVAFGLGIFYGDFISNGGVG